jgi:hypothetical protein
MNIWVPYMTGEFLNRVTNCLRFKHVSLLYEVSYFKNQTSQWRMFQISLYYYLHADESFLRSLELLSYWRNSQHLMEILGSLTCSHDSATGPYLQPDESSPTQDMPNIFCIPKFQCRVHCSLYWAKLIQLTPLSLPGINWTSKPASPACINWTSKPASPDHVSTELASQPLLTMYQVN